MALIPWWIHYPNVNDEIMNLDWLLKVCNENTDKIKNFINLNTIKYANPILWNIESQYEANTIVIDGQTGDAYISTKPVPSGVHLNRTEYWTIIYNYSNELNKLRSQIAHNEGNTTTASAAYADGDLVFVNELLYRVISNIIAGDSFVVDSNVVKTTIEEELKRGLTITNQLSNSVDGRLNTTNERIETVNENLSNQIEQTESRLNTSLVSINNRLLPLEAMPKKRTFILIGDSFGYGIQGGGAPWVTGWMAYAASKIRANGDDCFYLENPLEAEGNMGFASTRPWLSVLQEIESTYNIEDSKVTDIIVLGGSNDIDQTPTSIKTAITVFCNHCKTKYVNANISIGPLGIHADTLGAVAETYKEGSMTNGCKFIDDLFILMINPNYYSSGGHVTEAGYNFYNPYIADCVINGKTYFRFNYSITAELTTHASFEAGTFPLALFVEQTEKTIKVELMDSLRTSPIPIKLDSKGTTSLSIPECVTVTPFYAPLTNQIISGGTITLKEAGNSTRIPCRNGILYFSSTSKIGVGGSFYFDGTYDLIYDSNNYYASIVFNRGETIINHIKI